MGKLAFIAEKAKRSDMIDVSGLLRDVLERIGKKEWAANKVVLITLDDTDSKYDTMICNANMKPSEIIALLSVAKHQYELDLI